MSATSSASTSSAVCAAAQSEEFPRSRLFQGSRIASAASDAPQMSAAATWKGITDDLALCCSTATDAASEAKRKATFDKWSALQKRFLDSAPEIEQKLLRQYIDEKRPADVDRFLGHPQLASFAVQEICKLPVKEFPVSSRSREELIKALGAQIRQLETFTPTDLQDVSWESGVYDGKFHPPCALGSRCVGMSDVGRFTSPCIRQVVFMARLDKAGRDDIYARRASPPEGRMCVLDEMLAVGRYVLASASAAGMASVDGALFVKLYTPSGFHPRCILSLTPRWTGVPAFPRAIPEIQRVLVRGHVRLSLECMAEDPNAHSQPIAEMFADVSKAAERLHSERKAALAERPSSVAQDIHRTMSLF